MTKAQTITIELTERELKDIKLIRKYFGMNDETCHQQFLYSVTDMLVKKSQLKPCEHNIKPVKGWLHKCTKCPYTEFEPTVNNSLKPQEGEKKNTSIKQKIELDKQIWELRNKHPLKQ